MELSRLLHRSPLHNPMLLSESHSIIIRIIDATIISILIFPFIWSSTFPGRSSSYQRFASTQAPGLPFCRAHLENLPRGIWQHQWATYQVSQNINSVKFDSPPPIFKKGTTAFIYKRHFWLYIFEFKHLIWCFSFNKSWNLGISYSFLLRKVLGTGQRRILAKSFCS